MPTTAWTPASRQARTLATAVSGVVKSTTTSASASDLGELDPEGRVGLRGQLHVLGALDRLADGLAHAAGGPGGDDADHAATRLSLTGARASRKQASPRPTQAAESRSAP